MKVKKDGNMWCITAKVFKNLQESDAVFVTDEEYKIFIKTMVERVNKHESQYKLLSVDEKLTAGLMNITWKPDENKK